ncbi:hypothetical protein [Bradyrhizobium manausense]|nr:hypothetical protein [Bradyrhizobium manausense]
MILLRGFVLFILPVATAASGWLYAIDLRKRRSPGCAPERGAIPPASLAP